MHKQPTQEQIKEFWEWCGIKQDSDRSWRDADGIGVLVSTIMPDIDLNNLFKYAVPKLRENLSDDLRIYFNFGSCGYCSIYRWGKKYSRKKNFEWLKVGSYTDDDPALALFWAIWEVIHNGNGGE